MRRWFVLTLISGVFLTLSGCGGEVATETADTASGAATPATPPPMGSTPSGGGGASPASPMGTPMGGAPAGGGGGRNRLPLPGDPFAASMGNGGGQQQGGGGDPANPMGSGGQPGGNPYGPSGGNPNPYAAGGGGDPANPMGSGGRPGGNPYAPSGGGNPNPYAAGGGGDPANPMGSGPGGNPYGPMGGQGGVDPANPMGTGPGGAPPVDNSGGAGQGAVNVTVPGSQTGGGGGAGQGAVNVTVPGSQPGTGTPMGPPRPGSGFPGAPGQQPAAPEPQTLKEKAEYAFRQGRDDDGFQYMYAYMVADPEAEFDFGLLPVVNEPRTAVRWGVAIDYSAPGNFTKAPPTIGEQPNVLPEAGGRGRGGRGGFGAGGVPSVGEPSAGGGPSGFGGGAAGGGAQGPPTGGQAQLNYYTGELGKKLVERLNMRRTHDESFYGNFLKEIPFEYNPEAAGGFQQPRQGAGFNPMGAGVGSAGGGPTSGPVGNPYQPGGAAAAGPRRDPDTDQLIPGVVWLGRGRRVEMIDAARARGLDGLILIETKINVVPRTGLESNITKLFVFNVNAEETKDQVVYQTRSTLKNVPVWQAIQQGKEDPIEIELDKLFPEMADVEFKLGALPTLTPEQAKGRVDSISTSQPENALPILAEIKYFHKESLINDADLMSAYENLLGDAGAAKALASGEGKEREKAIEAWLPGNWEAPAGGGGDFR